MRYLLLALALLCSLQPSAHSTEIDMRPGLWEMTTSSDLLWLVPQIPPDQMQNLIAFAKQHGIDLPQIQMGAATTNTCITQEMAAQNNPPMFYQNQLGCIAKNLSRSGNTYRLDFVCTSPQLQGNGSAEGTFTNRESFTGRTEFNGSAQGAPVNEHADISGRWLSADCGAVKPLQ